FDTLPTGQTVDVSTFIEGGISVQIKPNVLRLQTKKQRNQEILFLRNTALKILGILVYFLKGGT
ncbi:hypothetical protein, partial [Heyndrickxia ginsengihumi]|uniref:hypothetical protein n=1 Tax=Heyndrickxia ginsengihumi TaxID=363870 RepID=UPI003D1AD64C